MHGQRPDKICCGSCFRSHAGFWLTDCSNDALRAHGILPPKPPSREPSPDIPHITHRDAVQAVAATADAQQLSLLLEGDGIDSDDERMFEDYRRKRLAQIKSLEKKGRFGSMEPLAREDFVKEVTEGSKMNAEGLIEPEEEPGSDEEENAAQAQASRFKGTGVVVFLYKDSYVQIQVQIQILPFHLPFHLSST